MANVDVFFSQIHVTFNGTVRSNDGISIHSSSVAVLGMEQLL